MNKTNLENPTVSVVMPVHNSEATLSEAIESIINQTFKKWEFIIIDDCSTDSSREIIQKYAAREDRIKIIDNDKQLYLSGSVNRGIKIAKGKYIARQDADDISLPERLVTQVNFLDKHPQVFLLGTSAIFIDEQDREIRRVKKKEKKIEIGITRQNKLFKQSILHPSIMFRNDKKHFYREKFVFSQDYDFYYQLLSDNKELWNTDQTLIKYRLPTEKVNLAKRYKQSLFHKKARNFYYQRKRQGYDNYALFNPTDIMDCQVPKKALLKHEIEQLFKTNRIREAKIKSTQYWKKVGPSPYAISIYLLCSLPKKLLPVIRRFFFK